MLRLQEQGKLTTLKIKWWKEKKGGGACAVSIHNGLRQNILILSTFDVQDSGDDAGALALEVANVEGVFLLLIVGSVAAIICSCLEMILDVLGRAMDNKVILNIQYVSSVET